MRRKIAIAAGIAAALIGVAACGADKTEPTVDPYDGTGKTVKVWLMVDAESSWKEVVEDATARFKAATKADVKVEYQQWANHLTKLDSTLAGADVPDVVELGNTEASKYVFNGGFADISQYKGRYENASSWLSGLSGPCESDGKTYCVPYYAGARVLIYRTDLFTAAGITPPTTYAELVAAAEKLKTANASDPNFAAFYMAGANWYAAMSWVYNEGGKIAEKGADGKWAGKLSDASAQKGLQSWADLVKNYSKGDVTKDENDQDAIFSQGHSAMLYGNAWEVGAVQSQKQDPNDPNSAMVDTAVKGKVAAIPLPGNTAGKGIPSFLGGSVLGVSEKSQNKTLASEWIKYFTDAKAMDGLIAKKALPNATSLLDKAAADKDVAPAANAAKSSWFPPNAENWADVEKANILQQMLRDIVTAKKSVAEAAAWADGEIAKALNAA